METVFKETTFRFTKISDMYKEMSEILTGAGYEVFPPARELTYTIQKAVLAELGISSSTLHRRLHSPDCPRFKARYGAKGSLRELHLTPKLIDYLKKPLLTTNHAKRKD